MYFPTANITVSPWLPPLVSFAISLFTSMGGVSGAFLLLPFQVSVLGFTSPAVSATNQLFNIVAIPSGVYRYIREGRMVWPLTWVVIIGTLPGVLLGAIIRVRYLPSPKNFTLFAGVVLLYIGGRLIKDLLRPSTPLRERKGGLSEQGNPVGDRSNPVSGQDQNTVKGQNQDTVVDGRSLSGVEGQNQTTVVDGRSLSGVEGQNQDTGEEGFQTMVRRLQKEDTTLPKVVVKEFSLTRIRYEFCHQSYSIPTLGISSLSFVVGIVGGVYGIGGGAIIAPFFVSVFGLPIYTVAGAALMGTFVTSVAGVGFYQLIAPWYPGMSVAPDWLLGFLFGIGGFAGMYCGARLQKFMPARIIKGLLALSILFPAVKYLTDFFR